MQNNISFFIPAYNCAKTITESVDSIMKTNFEEGDELIIVNDCVTDNTGEILTALQTKYPIIQIIKHQRNKGGAAARNTAVEDAKHELLFCLDSDNVLPEFSIRPLKQYLIDMHADVATFQFQHFFLTDKLKQEYVWSLPEGVVTLQSHLRGENTPGQHGNYLFTKSSWIKAKGYAEGTGALDTWTFGLRQAITGAKMVVLKDTFYYHRLDYANSYWMKDAQSKIWSVSMKVTQALFPFFDILDESFVEYILGDAKYKWFYNLKKRPVVLVQEGSKDQFYKELNSEVNNFVYPRPSIFQRIINRIKRELKIK